MNKPAAPAAPPAAGSEAVRVRPAQMQFPPTYIHRVANPHMQVIKNNEDVDFGAIIAIKFDQCQLLPSSQQGQASSGDKASGKRSAASFEFGGSDSDSSGEIIEGSSRSSRTYARQGRKEDSGSSGSTARGVGVVSAASTSHAESVRQTYKRPKIQRPIKR